MTINLRKSLFIAAAGAGAYYGMRAALRASRKIDLHDKVVLITGGSNGIGLVCASAFAAEGARNRNASLAPGRRGYARACCRAEGRR